MVNPRNAVSNLAGIASKVKVKVAEKSGDLDQAKLQNGVMEALHEADLIERNERRPTVDPMSDNFPIPIPARLPTKITPCPIVEAILEIRFVTSESWRTLPGLLYAKIRDRYPEQKDLALADMPEEMRRQQVAFANLPHMQFLGADFLIQFGPRVISLVTKPNKYPGWAALEKEMTWLLARLKECGFISEGERLGVRYVNFLHQNVFDQLILGVCVGQQPLTSGETAVTSVLRKKPFSARLHVANSVLLGDEAEVRKGSVLDIDVWLGALDFDLFEDGIAKINDAHRFEKEIFFGLLKPEFLASLNPEYT